MSIEKFVCSLRKPSPGPAVHELAYDDASDCDPQDDVDADPDRGASARYALFRRRTAI
jgi:hypothetical protein